MCITIDKNESLLSQDKNEAGNENGAKQRKIVKALISTSKKRGISVCNEAMFRIEIQLVLWVFSTVAIKIDFSLGKAILTIVCIE
jgi:hypothetical protein